MGYEKFPGIAVDIFTGLSCERFPGISADSQKRFLGIVTWIPSYFYTVWFKYYFLLLIQFGLSITFFFFKNSLV